MSGKFERKKSVKSDADQAKKADEKKKTRWKAREQDDTEDVFQKFLPSSLKFSIQFHLFSFLLLYFRNVDSIDISLFSFKHLVQRQSCQNRNQIQVMCL